MELPLHKSPTIAIFFVQAESRLSEPNQVWWKRRFGWITDFRLDLSPNNARNIDRSMSKSYLKVEMFSCEFFSFRACCVGCDKKLLGVPNEDWKFPCAFFLAVPVPFARLQYSLQLKFSFCVTGFAEPLCAPPLIEGIRVNNGTLEQIHILHIQSVAKQQRILYCVFLLEDAHFTAWNADCVWSLEGRISSVDHTSCCLWMTIKLIFIWAPLCLNRSDGYSLVHIRMGA